MATGDFTSLTEGDQVEQHKKLTEHLKLPSTIEQFTQDCRNIGQTAVAVDGHFKTVRDGLADLVRKYGCFFPDVQERFVPVWESFMARWDGENGLLWSSRNFASKTAAALDDYEENLDLIATSKTNKELEDMQAELRRYVEDHPISSATDLADEFKDLSRDIGKFGRDFKDYMQEQGQDLTKEAKTFEADMSKYQKEVDKFNKQIEAAAESLSCAGIFAILAIIPLVEFMKLFKKRNSAVIDLNKAKANLANVVRRQESLAAMQADFEKFRPNIEDICVKLGTFASIWAFVTDQSVQLSESLEGGMRVVTERKFVAKLNNLKAQIKPLKAGLNAYVVQIVPR